MAVVGKLYKLVWGGRLFDTETWSMGLHFNPSAVQTPDMQLIEDQIKAFHIAPNSRVSGAAKFDFFKFNEIDPQTALYANPNLAHTATIAGAFIGAGGSTPGQCTLAISLLTALQRGRGHIGRVFPPAGTQLLTVDATGRIPASYASDLADTAKTLVNSLGVTIGGPPCVYSKAAATATPLTGIKVGRVLDTQRRRRSQLLEDYQAISLA